VLGVTGVLALPFLARNVFLDENALLAGTLSRSPRTLAF